MSTNHIREVYAHAPSGKVNNELVDLYMSVIRLIQRAQSAGLIITVEQQSAGSPVMGRYQTHCYARVAINHKAEAAKRGGYTLKDN